jgi:hypothetical protein
MVSQKPQVWSSCKAHDAMEWQRHFERHATPQMGRNCGFWDQGTSSTGKSRGLLHMSPGWCPALPGKSAVQ